MKTFDDQEDVEEWLAPLSYEAFWNEIDPFDLDIEGRQSCDAQIASGSIDEATVLTVLKGMARLEMIALYGLKPRDRMPWRLVH